MLFALFAAGLLAAGIHAAPVPEADCNDQQVATSQAFSLVAKVIRPGLNKDVNNWVLTGVHSGAGQAVQAVVKSDPTDPSKVGGYYMNGTMKGTEPAGQKNANTVLATGAGRNPAGMRLWPVTQPTPNNYVDSVELGEGMPGIYVRYGGPKDKKPYPHLVGMSNDKGQFYICNLVLFDPSNPIQALYWRNETSSTPKDCSEVQMVSQCLGKVSNMTSYVDRLQDARCLNKAVEYKLPVSS